MSNPLSSHVCRSDTTDSSAVILFFHFQAQKLCFPSFKQRWNHPHLKGSSKLAELISDKQCLQPQMETTWSVSHIGWVDKLADCWLLARLFEAAAAEFSEKRGDTVLHGFYFHCARPRITPLLGFTGNESQRAGLPFVTKFDRVKLSITVVRAERGNHALHEAISISSLLHQTHSEKSLILHNLTAQSLSWSFKPAQHH